MWRYITIAYVLEHLIISSLKRSDSFISFGIRSDVSRSSGKVSSMAWLMIPLSSAGFISNVSFIKPLQYLVISYILLCKLPLKLVFVRKSIVIFYLSFVYIRSLFVLSVIATLLCSLYLLSAWVKSCLNSVWYTGLSRFVLVKVVKNAVSLCTNLNKIAGGILYCVGVVLSLYCIKLLRLSKDVRLWSILSVDHSW